VESEQQFDGNSIVNELEAECVLRTLQIFLNHGVKGEEIGIITPYKAQKRLFSREISKRMLPKCGVEISTVDGFQGFTFSHAVQSFNITFYIVAVGITDFLISLVCPSKVLFLQRNI